jgi:hypothetical protein
VVVVIVYFVLLMLLITNDGPTLPPRDGRTVPSLIPRPESDLRGSAHKQGDFITVPQIVFDSDSLKGEPLRTFDPWWAL